MHKDSVTVVKYAEMPQGKWQLILCVFTWSHELVIPALYRLNSIELWIRLA